MACPFGNRRALALGLRGRKTAPEVSLSFIVFVFHFTVAKETAGAAHISCGKDVSRQRSAESCIEVMAREMEPGAQSARRSEGSGRCR